VKCCYCDTPTDPYDGTVRVADTKFPTGERWAWAEVSASEAHTTTHPDPSAYPVSPLSKQIAAQASGRDTTTCDDPACTIAGHTPTCLNNRRLADTTTFPTPAPGHDESCGSSACAVCYLEAKLEQAERERDELRPLVELLHRAAACLYIECAVNGGGSIGAQDVLAKYAAMYPEEWSDVAGE
jgi:hypothetical protein